MRLTLVRHAEPEWVRDGLAVDDPPLTERGRRQAERLAERLSAQRPPDRPPLQCLIEINAEAEISKGGVAFEALGELVAAVRVLPGLTLRGFMAMPPPREDPVLQRAVFEDIVRRVAAWVPELDTLSLGTSGDFEAAIAAGSTLVRIGTAVFGPRERPPSA